MARVLQPLCHAAPGPVARGVALPEKVEVLLWQQSGSSGCWKSSMGMPGRYPGVPA
ncbi:hypothetical protein [Pseudomonas sp. MN1F]|uniref:hypothetical protein n=1 Tax=Pseudomonas sp. MN1F TaxID=1366632 RepID=UPI00128FBEDB|nr:hypothetical protein [Pseudomonas sp. MN1F]